MVPDDEIKSTISPFAVRQEEIKVFDGYDGYVSMDKIMSKVNQGVITDIHFKIIELINKFEFLTSRQLFMLLENEGIELKNQDKLNNKIDTLVKNKIITKYYFKSHDGMSGFRVIALEKMGKYLLKSREIECGWQPTDNCKPVPMVKKKLAGNQLVINYIRKVKTLKSYKLKPEVVSKGFGKSFKPMANLVLNYNNKDFNFVYEVIRREQDGDSFLINRMNYWCDFYRSFAPGDSGYDSLPQLILLCEDNKHMAEVFKTIIMNIINIPNNMKIYFTTDMLQNEATLEKSLNEFVLVDGKYKMKNLIAKIIG